MSKLKATPGPWKWWTACSWRRLKRDDPRDDSPVLMPHVCRDGQPDITVTEADMALIAAAPEMYEALENAVNLVRIHTGPDDRIAQAAIAQAEAALSRARGEKE